MGLCETIKKGPANPNKTCRRYLRISIFGLLLLLSPIADASSVGQSGQDAAVLGLLYVLAISF